MYKRQPPQRYITVFSTVFGLLLSSMVLASTEQTAEPAPEKEYKRFPAGTNLTDTDMGDATARGAHESFAYLQSILTGDNDGSNGEDNLENIAKLIIPISDLLDYDMVMSGVTYSAGDSTTINPDGSIQLLLPNHIDQISYKNIRPKGSKNGIVGNVSVNDIDLSGSAALIRNVD